MGRSDSATYMFLLGMDISMRILVGEGEPGVEARPGVFSQRMPRALPGACHAGASLTHVRASRGGAICGTFFGAGCDTATTSTAQPVSCYVVPTGRGNATWPAKAPRSTANSLERSVLRNFYARQLVPA